MLSRYLVNEPAAHEAGSVDGHQHPQTVPLHCHNRRFIMPAHSYAGGIAAEYAAICERSVQKV